MHEVRNPLNAIKANLQLLEEDMVRQEQGDGPHTRRVRRLLKEVARLDNILTNFLDFVRGDEFRFAPCDLAQLMGEIVSLLTPQADDMGVTVFSELEEGLLAEVDKGALKAAIMNLTINGIQAMRPEKHPRAEGAGISLTLIVRLRKSGESAIIEIIDTGPGIPEEIRDRIFDLFYTTRDGGSGIGLAVASKVVAGHEGTIMCSSELGKGTSFRIEIPLRRAPGI